MSCRNENYQNYYYLSELVATVNKLGLAADTGSKQESGWVDSVLGQLARVVAGPSFDTVNR